MESDMTPKIPILIATAMLALAAPVAGYAKNDKHNHAAPAAQGCPPGLAKKSPSCVPPGQAKKHKGHDEDHHYRKGDRIERDYVVINNPGRYGLNPDGTYYRYGDGIYRVDRNTREILDFIGAAAALLD